MSPMVVQAGAIRAELVSAQLGGVIVGMATYSFPVATRGETLDERIGFAVVSPRMSSVQLNGEPITPGVARVFGGAAEVAGAGGPLEQLTISFRAADLERMARALGVEIDLPSRGTSGSRTLVDEVRLRRVMRDLRTSVRKTGKSASSIEEAEEISDTLVEIAVRTLAADHRGGRRQPARPCEQRARRPSVRGIRRGHALPERDACRDFAARPACRSGGSGKPSTSVSAFLPLRTCVSPRSTRSATRCWKGCRRATPSPGPPPSSGSGT